MGRRLIFLIVVKLYKPSPDVVNNDHHGDNNKGYNYALNHIFFFELVK